jgi:hypothetical protein
MGRSFEEIVELLERAGEHRAAEILRLRADPKRIERLAAVLDEQAVDPNLGDWMRLRYRDAGLYLDRIAEPRERIAGFLARAAEIREALARDGRWSESWEWRIMTVGMETIEALPGGGFRALAEHHGTFRVDFAMASASPTPERAREFAGIYERLQRDLRNVLHWGWLDD